MRYKTEDGHIYETYADLKKDYMNITDNGTSPDAWTSRDLRDEDGDLDDSVPDDFDHEAHMMEGIEIID